MDSRALLQFVLVHLEVFSMSRFAAPAPCLEGFNVTNRQRGPSAKPLDLFCGKRHEGPNHSYHSLIGKTTQLNHQGCTPRPAPAPGKMAAPGCPGPENFQLCPAPPLKNVVLPRPAPKIVPGQGSGQTFLHHHKVLGIKNFLAVFSALKVLFKDI